MSLTLLQLAAELITAVIEQAPNLATFIALMGTNRLLRDLCRDVKSRMVAKLMSTVYISQERLEFMEWPSRAVNATMTSKGVRHGPYETSSEVVLADNIFFRVHGQYRYGKPVGKWTVKSELGDLLQISYFCRDGGYVRVHMFRGPAPSYPGATPTPPEPCNNPLCLERFDKDHILVSSQKWNPDGSPVVYILGPCQALTKKGVPCKNRSKIDRRCHLHQDKAKYISYERPAWSEALLPKPEEYAYED